MRYVIFVLFVVHNAILFGQCLGGNCWEGRGKYQYPSGATYVGDFKKGRIHGNGVLYFSNGDVYSGQWIDHYRTGKGKINYTTGDSYEGDFIKNKFEGTGRYRYKNGDIYEGQWQNHIAEGNGEYFFSNGDLYIGQFKKGKFHGSGTMHYQDGAVFKGTWLENKKHGLGKLITASGKIFSGKWIKGKFQKDSPSKNKIKNNPSPSIKERSLGPSTFVYNDGSKYIGEFKGSIPEGNGTVFYSNGDKYVGGWKNHAPHGDGIMYYKYGRVLSAVWDEGHVKKILQNVQDIPEEIVEVKHSEESKLWSVIVGVGDYNHMPALNYADDDAYRLYAFLKSPEGGALKDEQISILIDDQANRENILRTLKRIFFQADQNDIVMLYLSGHGFKGSFIPFDYDGCNNLVKYHEIIDIISESNASQKLVIADACYSGSINKNNFAPNQNHLVSSVNTSKSKIGLLLSSQKDEYSLEDQGLKQGIFSHFLIRGLKGEANKNGDEIIDMSEISAFVNKNVERYTNGFQNPITAGNCDPGLPLSYIR